MIRNFYRKYGYFVLLAYLIAAYFYFPLGVIAVICMMAPVIFALAGKGRYWCGNFCPRGCFYQNVTSKLSRKKPIPKFLKSVAFRIFMVLFIIGNFSYGIYMNWGNAAGIGFVFYRIIVITTIVGIIFNMIYMPRTWCAFCPMGSIATYITYLENMRKKKHTGELAKEL